MYENELKEIFDNNKHIFDDAYEQTKKEYGTGYASDTMRNYFISYNTDSIINETAKANMNKFLYHGSEIQQFLIEYAMSSYILNNMECKLSLSDIRKYTDTSNKELKYDPDSIISVVAVGATWSPYWMTNLLACNQRVKATLVDRLIKERYLDNRKDDLDTCRKTKMVKLPDGKTFMMSVSKLNRDIDNMIRDEESSYFIEDMNEYQNNYTR